MIVESFDYVVLSMLEEVFQLLYELGDEVKILVGGYSLIFMMKLCFVVLMYLIDINNILGFVYIKEEGGYLYIGVLICEFDLEEFDIIIFRYYIFMDVFKLIVDL